MSDVVEVEKVLSRLLMPNNDVIKQATKELAMALKNPQTYITLCELIGTVNKSDELKGYATLVLKKKLSKWSVWKNLSQEVCLQIKQFVLKTIIDEHSYKVKKHILQLIAVVAKHDVMRGKWNELFDFVDFHVRSDDENKRRFGMFVIRNLSDYIPQMFESHITRFINYFFTTLMNATDPTSSIVYDTIYSMKNVMELTVHDSRVLQSYSRSVPRVLKAVLALSTTDPAHADDCLQFIDDLCEFSVQSITPHIKPIVQVSAQLASNKTIDRTLRCTGINLITTVIRCERKGFVQLNLLQPVTELMFNILSQETDDSTWLVSHLENYDANPMNVAGDCITAISEEISGRAFMPIIMKLIDSAYTTQDPNALKASYLMIAFASDGCSEYLKKNYIKQFVTAIKIGLNSSDEMVKSAAMYALGEVSQYVQPEVSVYASEILPELMKMLKEKLIIEYTKPECSSEVRMIIYAIDKFIQNIKFGIEEYIPKITAIVLDIIGNEQCCTELKHEAITIMCSTVKCGGESVASYFTPIMEILNAYLTPGIEEKLELLQVMVIKLLSEFVDALDPNVYELYLDASLKCGLTLLQEAKKDQPEVRAVCYGLFITIGKVSLNSLVPHMDIIMQRVLKSLNNSSIVDNGLQEKKFYVYSSDDDDNKDDDDDNDESLAIDDDAAYVDAHVVEEKESACRIIAQFAHFTGEIFLPYLNKSFQVVSKLLDEDDEDTIDPALQAYGQLCFNVSQLSDSESQMSLEKAIEIFLNYGEQKIQEDGLEAIDVTFLEVLTGMLKHIGSKMVKCAQPIMVLAKNLLALKIGDENNSGFDELECAGNVVSSLSYVVPPHVFEEYFTSLVPLFKVLLGEDSSGTLRAIGLCIIGESAKGLDGINGELPELMFSLVIQCVADEDDNVRHNSVFALGEIVFFGKQSAYKYYPMILNAFSEIVAKEQRSEVLDNVYGALARMIITNIDGVPQDHVIPAMINYLPLHKDFTENCMIYYCLTHLYEMGNHYMFSMAEPVIKASLVTLSDKKKYTREAEMEILKLLHMYKRDFPDKCLMLTLPEDLKKLFDEIEFQ